MGELRVHVEKPAVERRHGNANRCLVEDRSKALLVLAECFLRLQELFFGTLSREQNTVGVLQRYRSQQLVFVVHGRHYRLPSAAAARAVPSTRARIFSNAVSRVVDLPSQNGENPQSSGVPTWSSAMYSAASRTRSRTSFAVSTFGSIGATTPTNTLCPGFIYCRMIFNTCGRFGSPASAM